MSAFQAEGNLGLLPFRVDFIPSTHREFPHRETPAVTPEQRDKQIYESQLQQRPVR